WKRPGGGLRSHSLRAPYSLEDHLSRPLTRSLPKRTSARRTSVITCRLGASLYGRLQTTPIPLDTIRTFGTRAEATHGRHSDFSSKKSDGYFAFGLGGFTIY